MYFPKSIKINGISYKIEFVNEIEDSMHTPEYIGRVIYKNHKIKILSNYPVSKQFRVLLHESIHILDEDFKIGLEENAICRLEAGLFQVLTDNKLLKE